MVVSNSDILRVLGKNIKQARKKLKYTQDFVAEGIDVSVDLLRNIENGRNIGSVPTIINLCNFLKVSPNTLFGELLDFKEDTLDSYLQEQIRAISDKDKNIIKNIIIHIDEHY